MVQKEDRFEVTVRDPNGFSGPETRIIVDKKTGVESFTDTRVCGVYLLPCFGATELDEKAGYMLVPEAAGALINFSNGEGVGTTPFSKRIYGTNIGVDQSVMTELNRPAEQITLPV